MMLCNDETTDYFKNLAFTPESKVSLAEAALRIAWMNILNSIYRITPMF